MGKYDKRAKILLMFSAVLLAFIIAIPVTMYLDKKMNETTCEYPEKVNEDYTVYDGRTVKGSIVLWLMSKYVDKNTAIEVITENGDYWYNYTDESLLEESNLEIDSVYNKNNENYIDPKSSYEVTMTKSDNDEVIVVSFEEVEK